MSFLADLHIHSPFSRATSKASNLAGLFAWAQVKGIHLIGTGDFTHPGWLAQLKNDLVPAEPGLFRLKDDKVPPAFEQARPEIINVRFVLTAEISSIYKRHGKVRKVHNILFAPDFQSVEQMNQSLAAIGNIESDGRPILGLDSRDLLEIQLEKIPAGFLVPAHIWTPWFSLFGSKSGFDTIEECFGDLSQHIFALETGLSSDPEMNRLVSALDRFTLISNSDCHSPGKLGREVNLFDCDLDFYSMKDALQDPQKGFAGTMEFFPEEGKYHLDGHRKCNVSLTPAETRECNALCPQCGKPLTIGVSHRVMDLADRDKPVYPDHGSTFQSLIPLQEVIGEIMGRGPATKGVLGQYRKVINRFGSEFTLFRHTPIEDIKKLSPLLAEAVDRIRNNKVIRQAGFDGQFGVIHVFADGEIDRLSGQGRLFDDMRPQPKKKKVAPQKPKNMPLPLFSNTPKTHPSTKESNAEQQEAITCSANKILVSAGPGTGKTFTLVSRLIHLLTVRNVAADKIVAITFTNRAAEEMQQRLLNQVGKRATPVFVGTFHKFCLNWLQHFNPSLTVIGDEGRHLIIRKLFADKSVHERTAISHLIKNSFPASHDNSQEAEILRLYQHELAQQHAIDLEDIIPTFVSKLASDDVFDQAVRNQVDHLFVDEFQDVNQAQYQLVEKLTHSASLFAIGDANQAIYGFRGSDLSFFMQLADSATTTNLILNKNYRSARSIIEASSSLISHNKIKNKSRLDAQSNENGSITLHTTLSTAKAEAEYVVTEIEKILGGISSFSIDSGRSAGQISDFSFADIAILYRLGRQADVLAKALERRGIPYQRVGSKPFYMDRDLRGVYYWLLAAEGNASRADYLQLCQQVPGIGKTTLNLLDSKIPPTSHDFFTDLRGLPLRPKTTEIFRRLSSELASFRNMADRDLPARMAIPFHFFNIDQNQPKAQRLSKLAGAFGSLAPFTAHLQKNAQATIYDDRAEAVSLMTLHAAKGLEFPVVFITGLIDGLLPCKAPGCDLEEERRLLYVGMSRAEKALFLSAADRKRLSPFVTEVPAHLCHKAGDKVRKRKQPTARQLKLF